MRDKIRFVLHEIKYTNHVEKKKEYNVRAEYIIEISNNGIIIFDSIVLLNLLHAFDLDNKKFKTNDSS